MKETVKRYIPFIAGMATMVLLVCLISASLAKEDPPAAQPQAESQPQVQAGDLRLARSEAGIALFGVERVAPGEALTAENGAEIPAVLTYTDEKGEVHYYVEAEAIGDILDVCHKVMYRDTSNCVEFGVEPFLNDRGEQQVKGPKKEPVWFTGDVTCDIDYALSIDSETGEKTGYARGTQFTANGVASSFDRGNSSQRVLTEEEKAERAKQDEEFRLSTPLKPEYGASGGMYTEVDPAEVDMDSWSGTAMKGQKSRSENAELVERTFAFTPYLGEYAVITVANTGTEDIRLLVNRPNTVGNRKGDYTFTSVRVPAGQTLARAFRIDENLPLENRLTVQAITFTDQDIEFTLTAEQYRFGN